MNYKKLVKNSKINKVLLTLAVFALVIGQFIALKPVYSAENGILAMAGRVLDFANFSEKEQNILPESGPREADKVVHAVITAYTSTPNQTDDTPFIAAWGDRVYDGMIAANWLPRGTKIRIPSLYGDKIFTVADRMNSRYGYGRLDIWMDTTRTEARKFGVQRVDVEVYYN